LVFPRFDGRYGSGMKAQVGEGEGGGKRGEVRHERGGERQDIINYVTAKNEAASHQ